MAGYQAGPSPLQLGPPPPPFWQAAQAGPSYAHSYSQAPQAPGGFMAHQLGPPPMPAPPPHQPPLAAADDRLRSVDELPACFRGVFPFRYFNAIQNECWPTIYEAGHNVVIAAPTGGGKTVLLELAILRLLSSHIAPGSGQWAHQPGHLKSVYLAPSRALVQEKVRDWTQRFGVLGITCRELTGDTDREGLEDLDSADIICATPEKFDAVTRSGMRFFADIGLVLIDEVHLLNENRGSSLEGVVVRIKVVSRLREMREQAIGGVRYVAVSATIPNVRDLAEWLGAPPAGIKCFGEEMRPVKLRTVVRGYQPTKTDFLFERRLNDYIFEIVSEFSSGKPSLVFCSSRRGTSETAAALAKAAAQAAEGGRPSVFVRDPAQHARLVAAAARLGDTHLRECVQLGVGYHHAAMEPEERAAVEALFSTQDLPVLCTTSTLAMGVNLPARLVVIKGTRRYIGSEAEDPSGYQEYERSTCLQMVGRAGRPQFDTEGVAVIMTQKPHVRRYEQLASGSELVESMIKEVLPELLNAEITLRTITDVAQAVAWLRSTYFYVRVKRDPGRYDVPRQPTTEALDRWLRDRLLMGCLRELAEHGMVRLHDDGMGLEPLQPGAIMAEKYVRMATMKSLTGAPQGAGIPDLIGIVARSAELANIKLRRSEKKASTVTVTSGPVQQERQQQQRPQRPEVVLNGVNHSDRVRFPLMNPAKPGKVLERVATGADKIFVLVNEGLADTPTDKLEYSLRQDVEQAVTVGKRLAGAMVRFFEHEGRASETFNALLLAKSLRQRMWTDSTVETRQLAGIGPQIAQCLAAAGVAKLVQLADIEPRRLENLAQRHYPFGNEVHAALAKCLPPAAKLQCLPVSWLPGRLVELEITVERVSGSDAPSPCRLLVGSLHDNALLLCRALALESFPSPLVLRTRTRSPVKGRGTPIQVVASIVHERLVGVDSAIKVVVPPGVELQGRACQPALKQEQQQEQQHGQQLEQQSGPADESSAADEGASAAEAAGAGLAAGRPKPAKAEAAGLAAMASPGLPSQLEAVLQQLTDNRDTVDLDAAIQVLDVAGDVTHQAVAWQATNDNAREAAVLSRIVSSAASQLAPLQDALLQRLSAGGAASIQSAEQILLHSTANIILGCLSLAPHCGASSEARLQLARLGMQHVAAAGPPLLSHERNKDSHPKLVIGLVSSRLQQQLLLAPACMRASGFSAAAAAEAAPPAQLAAYLAAAVEAIDWLGSSGEQAEQREAIPPRIATCHVLSDEEAWEEHAAAVAAQPVLTQAIMRLCLSQASVLAVGLTLPEERRPTGCTMDGASQLFSLLSYGNLLPGAIKACFATAGSGSAAAAVAATAQIAQQLERLDALARPDIGLPQSRGLVGFPPNRPQQALAAAHLAALQAHMDVLLQQGRALPLDCLVTHTNQDVQVLSAVLIALDDVQKAASSELHGSGTGSGNSGNSDGSGESSSAAAPEQAALLEEVRQALAAYNAAAPSARRPVAGLWRPVLPPARRLAAAMLAWWRGPAVQQEQQLEAAQVAAARSCAYLRCANLGGGGGPAAGQGEGSLRCSSPGGVQGAKGAPVGTWSLICAAMEAPGLAAQLEALLQQLAGDVESAEVVRAAAEQAIALRACVMNESLDSCNEDEALKLRRVGACGGRIDGCLPVLAPGCQTSDEAQLQLAQAALSLLMSSGPVLLRQAASWLRDTLVGTEQQCFTHLRVQLELAEFSMLVPGFSPAAAADAAPPDKFAAWLAAAVDVLEQMGRRFGQGEDCRTTQQRYALCIAHATALMQCNSRCSIAQHCCVTAASVAAGSWKAAWQATLQCALVGPTLPVLLASGNCMEAMLQVAEQLQDGELLKAVLDILGTLQTAGLEVAAARSGSDGNASAAPADEAALLEHVQQAAACRAVWYCGTACSHADWRAGHRRMCKAMGAARAAEKAARQAAAEAAAEQPSS
ncbi:putative ATP-dependent DNA helicase HFM1 isoform A [Chlorella sorokiniana]|uniref:DNA 3'-5' helicase n=1 Tax=Chlorella sorokiniana TaxID=3076 RepID=A0A2P6TQF2_CHLSO|nr:putative ATP-dependent DNA helicase HFM1 isoform A [Chlorella sorokiniana]|eukprot:PRW56253.1 putative ATP-dependent DNA helicase HFM1 isoform A [Chlorella sorokiniana]